MALFATSQSERRFGRVLDLLASRWATTLAVLIVLVVAVTSFGMVNDGRRSAERAQELFAGPSVRENAIAVSDIYRLRSAVDRAIREGAFSAEVEEEFMSALDILYVRATNFRRNLAFVPYRVDGAQALAAMEHVVTISDAKVESGFDDLPAFAAELGEAARSANTALAFYMNALNNDQQDALSNTVFSLKELTSLHSSFLVAMVSLVLVLQTLLRREVMNRRRRSEAESRANFLAYHDALTGLGNRTTFNEALRTHFQDHDRLRVRPQALAFIDIDDFKDVNDTYGHRTGDAILRHVAAAIAKAADKHDAVAARVAGDEFAVLIPHGGTDSLLRFGRHLGRDVNRTVQYDGNTLKPSISIGIAATDGVAKVAKIDPQTMSRAADFALFAAKSSPEKGSIRLFDANLAQEYSDRRTLLTALERAIDQGEIDIWLQPQIDLCALTLSGFEALARWTHDGKMVPPDIFIPLAEEAGLISKLDLLVLQKATKAAAAWNAQHHQMASISVNISGAHVTSPRLLEHVERALAAADLAPQLLTVELTETVEVSDWDTVGARLAEIGALGCKLSIDDFGSGYSSLGYLRKMPAQELKIDRSLVSGIETSQDGRSILTSVIDIAHSLKFRTVVEGIETPEQARIARNLGCSHAQGYLFARPTPLDKIGPPQSLFPLAVLDKLGPEGGTAEMATPA